MHAIAIGINLTWLSSGDADALRTALHVIPEAERKPETDNLETALRSAVAQLEALRDEEDSDELPLWLRFLKRRDGELAHEGVVVMSYLLGYAPEGMEASELSAKHRAEREALCAALRRVHGGEMAAQVEVRVRARVTPRALRRFGDDTRATSRHHGSH